MTTKIIQGQSIAPGLAQGALALLHGAGKPAGADAHRAPGPPGAEISRFNEQVAALVADLRDTVVRLEAQPEPEAAAILSTHILLLEDTSFRRGVEETIQRDRVSAEHAVERTIGLTIAALERSNNPVMRERAPDLTELSLRLRGRLSGMRTSFLLGLPQDPSECVLAITELLPSLVLEARERGVRAFVVDKGTSLSHAAILANSFGLPVLRVAHLGSLATREGAQVLVDAVRGELVIDPSQAETARRTTPVKATAPAVGVGNTRAHVWLTIMDPEQLRDADWNGVEGVGLYRTEMLFMHGRTDLPSEAEQEAAYRRLFELCGDRPVTVRTLDVGGDKRLHYFSLGPQENPALGLRAHRIYRFHPEILVTQVRAILKAAGDHPRLRLMFPMIECLEEWTFVQGLVDRALESLRHEGSPHPARFERGVLLETPSAVWSFRRLLQVVDFASVGTNDLVQYLFAVDRTNANVARRYRPEHPVVLGVLRDLATAAKRAGKRLSLCGEIGSDPLLLPLLVGLGVADLSVPVNRVGMVRHRLAGFRMRQCRQLARTCLAADTADEVLEHLDPDRTRVRDSAHEDGEVASSVDPVCGMAVFTEGNPLTAVRDGRRFHFCSRACLETFMRQE